LVRPAAIGYCTAIPGLQAYLFRRTYPELWQTHMEGPGSFRVLLAKAVAAGAAAIVKNETRCSNGSRISRNHCQYEANKCNFQGAASLPRSESPNFAPQDSQRKRLPGILRATASLILTLSPEQEMWPPASLAPL